MTNKSRLSEIFSSRVKRPAKKTLRKGGHFSWLAGAMIALSVVVIGQLPDHIRTAAASRGVLRTEGFAGADTVARLLQDESLQRAAAGQLIWIDEAGLIGARTMHDVFALADDELEAVVHNPTPSML